MESALVAAQAKLMKPDASGVSLHDHLVSVLDKIIVDDPHDAVAMFEQISLSVKRQQVVPRKEYLQTVPEPAAPALVAMRDVLRSKAQLLDECECPHVCEENGYFEGAGHALLRDEAFVLRAAMVKHAAEKGLRTVRFFGKVLGTAADYYVLEGAYAEEPEPTEDEAAPAPDPKAVPAEENGTGCNKFRFWVCTELGAPWVELPAAKPAAIVAARSLKKLFTGRLDAPVAAHPPFPGNEADYLRAQIARILHSTYVAPAGMFTADEESEEEPKPVALTEEWEPPEPDELAAPSGWVHFYPGILKAGRLSKPPKPEEEEGEEGGEAQEEEDEPSQLLAELGADPPILEADETPVPAWAVRSAGERQYKVCYALSQAWPGAVAFCSTKPSVKFANLYIGNGLENTGRTFTPTPMPELSTEPEDAAEAEDTPLEAENALLKALEEKRMVEEAEAEEEEAAE